MKLVIETYRSAQPDIVWGRVIVRYIFGIQGASQCPDPCRREPTPVLYAIVGKNCWQGSWNPTGFQRRARVGLCAYALNLPFAASFHQSRMNIQMVLIGAIEFKPWLSGHAVSECFDLFAGDRELTNMEEFQFWYRPIE